MAGVMLDTGLFPTALWVFAVTLAAGVLLLVGAGRSSGPAGYRPVQSVHSGDPPRAGGLAMALALTASAGVTAWPDWTAIILSGLPVLVASLAEDSGMPVAPGWRLAAAAVASLACALTLDGFLPTMEAIPGGAPGVVPGGGAIAAVMATLLLTTGLCHAFNLIDGLNGLSAGTGVIVALSLGAVAIASGQPQWAMACGMVLAALTGFLCLNYPGGWLFAGDAGACLIGHLLAWIAVAMLIGDPGISPWSMLLIFFWPLADTGLALLRRLVRGRAFSRPDRRHIHHVVLRLVQALLFDGAPGPGRALGGGAAGGGAAQVCNPRAAGRLSGRAANPLATAAILPCAAVPACLGVWLWNSPAAALIALVAMTLSVAVFYGIGMLAMPGVLRRSAARRRAETSRARPPGFPGEISLRHGHSSVRRISANTQQYKASDCDQ